MSSPTIVVLGASGTQGGAVVRELSKDGKWHVKAVTRDTNKPSAKELTRLPNVEIVFADMEDKFSLSKVFQNAYGVFSVQNFWEVGFEGEIRQGKNVATVAKEQNIQHLVYSTLPDCNVDHLKSKAMVQKYIEEIGVPASFLQPWCFQNNFNKFFIPQKNEKGEFIVTQPGSWIILRNISNIITSRKRK